MSQVAVASFVLDVGTSLGRARAHCDVPGVAHVAGRLLLGHGAGGGIDARDLLVARAVAVEAGWAVARIEQPWRVAGKRVAPAPLRLDVAWLEVTRALVGSSGSGISAASGRSLAAFGTPSPLVLGGRSAGARVACRTGAELGAVGVVCLSFPLHPPGRPERSRAAELAAVTCPVLVVQGERDPFGGPDDVRAVAPAAARVVPVRSDHSLARDADSVSRAVAAFLKGF
ncbi:MAG: alpha/beta family hydrolase [Actinomycetes bacterium]